MALTREIARVIGHHYPGWLWYVEVSHKRGIVKITIPILFGNWGYYCHISKIDPGMKSIIRGCGELLESKGLPRSQFSAADWIAAKNTIPLGGPIRAGQDPRLIAKRQPPKPGPVIHA